MLILLRDHIYNNYQGLLQKARAGYIGLSLFEIDSGIRRQQLARYVASGCFINDVTGEIVQVKKDIEHSKCFCVQWFPSGGEK